MIKINENIYTYDYDFKMGGGVFFPARCIIVKNNNELTLISPGPFHEAVFNQIHTLGEVKQIIAPNCFHHAYINTALRHFPQAQLYMPYTLNKKYPGKFLAEHENLLEKAQISNLLLKQVSGHKVLSETVFFEPSSKTLILTDLIFNIEKTKNVISNIFFSLLTLKGKPKLSPLIKFTVKDKAVFFDDLREILNLDFETVVMAHGTPISSEAKATLQSAWGIDL